MEEGFGAINMNNVNSKKSLSAAFRTAYRAGCGMGFALVSLGLLGIYLLIFFSFNHTNQFL